MRVRPTCDGGGGAERRRRGHPPPCVTFRPVVVSLRGPWTVTRSSLRMLRRVAAFCRPLRPVLLLVPPPPKKSGGTPENTHYVVSDRCPVGLWEGDVRQWLKGDSEGELLWKAPAVSCVWAELWSSAMSHRTSRCTMHCSVAGAWGCRALPWGHHLMGETASPPTDPPPQRSSGRVREGGGGSGTQKFGYQKRPDQILSNSTFRFFPL